MNRWLFPVLLFLSGCGHSLPPTHHKIGKRTIFIMAVRSIDGVAPTSQSSRTGSAMHLVAGTHTVVVVSDAQQVGDLHCFDGPKNYRLHTFEFTSGEPHTYHVNNEMLAVPNLSIFDEDDHPVTSIHTGDYMPGTAPELEEQP